MFNVKSISDSIKPLLGILFIAFLAFVYFVISSFNEAVAVEVQKAGAFSARVSYEVESRIDSYYHQLKALDDNISNLSEVSNHEDMTRRVENYFVASPEIIALGFIVENQIKDYMAINEDFESGEIVYTSDWYEDILGHYKFQFLSSSKSYVLVTIPVENNKYDEMTMVIDINLLASEFYTNDDYDLSLIFDHSRILYSDDKNIIQVLRDKFGPDVFNDFVPYTRERQDFRVGDSNYIDGHIVHYENIFNHLSLLTSKTFNRLSYKNVEDNIMSHLVVFILMTISVGLTINYNTKKTKTWIETDRQFLNEIIEMDKVQVSNLKDELSFYTNLFQDGPEPMLLIDKETHKIMNVNKKTSELLGYDMDELTSMYLNTVFRWEDEDVINGLLRVQIKKQSDEIVNRIVRIQEITHADKDLLMIVVLREKMLSRQKDNHLELFHEIRGPLQGAIGAVSMIEKASNHYGDYTSIIKRSLNTVLIMTNNILSEGKLKSTYEQLIKKEVNLVSLVDEVVKTVVFQDQNYNMIAGKVQENKEDTLINLDQYYIKTDPMKLRQILINLMTNASKYTKDGMVDLTVTVERGSKDLLTFRVSDTGTGLDKSEIDHLFEDYKTFHKSQVTSTGIGLGITKKYIEMLESQLQVSSEKGIGSQFSFILQVESIENNDVLRTSDKSILVLDDDVVSCEFLKKYLQQELNCYVKTISNENKLLLELMSHDYDCLIIDQTLNHFMGVDLIHLIKKSHNNQIKDIPIVLITATDHKEVYQGDTEINKVLLKPFDNNRVAEVIKSIFADKQDKHPLEKYIDGTIIDKNIFFETFESVGREVFIELVNKFIANGIDEILLMDHLIENQNYPMLAGVLHRYKGSMSYFGPIEMMALVVELEEQAQTKDDTIVSNYKAFKKLNDAFINELKIFIKNINVEKSFE